MSHKNQILRKIGIRSRLRAGAGASRERPLVSKRRREHEPSSDPRLDTQFARVPYMRPLRVCQMKAALSVA